MKKKKIVWELSELKLENSVITIGNFDGVHLGHQQLIKSTVTEARISGFSSVVLTFNRHPQDFINPGKRTKVITPLSTKMEAIKSLGVDVLTVVDFNHDFSMLSPEEFVREVTCKQLGARKIVVGPDFGFGKNRAGNVETLRQMGKKYGFTVMVVPFIKMGEIKVSSSRIRSLLWKGEAEAALLMLGRNYNVTG